jgi:hypothetical protein
LENGYGIVTRTSLEIGFKPGDHFSQNNCEIKRIERMREMYEQWDKSPKIPVLIVDCTWNRCMNSFSSRPCKLHWNWTSQDGIDLCTDIRTEIKAAERGCKSDMSKKTPRFEWDWFDEICLKYKILHYCQWSIRLESITYEFYMNKVKSIF